jgi:hypothetical protein
VRINDDAASHFAMRRATKSCYMLREEEGGGEGEREEEENKEVIRKE